MSVIRLSAPDPEYRVGDLIRHDGEDCKVVAVGDEWVEIVVSDTTPTTVGLCPVHAAEFYMPDAHPGDICPQCDQQLVIYEREPTEEDFK